MLFVLVTTLYALVRLTIGNFAAAQKGGTVELVNSLTSAILIVLAVYLVIRAIAAVRGRTPAPEPAIA
jgi:hypothetical protein